MKKLLLLLLILAVPFSCDDGNDQNNPIPNVSLSITTDRDTLVGQIVLNLLIEPSKDIVEVKVYFDENEIFHNITSPWSFDWNTLDFINGWHTLFAGAKHKNGKWGYSDTIQVYLNNPLPTPPVANFTVIVNGLDVQLDGTSSYDSDGTIISWDWQFGDGQSANGQTVSHTFNRKSLYTISLTVTDDRGETGNKSLEVEVPPFLAPIAVADVAPITGKPPLAVSFDGENSSDPDGVIADYYWDFGDGTTDDGIRNNHTYASEGVYNGFLEVTDDDGKTARDSFTITVIANQPPIPNISVTPTSGYLPLTVNVSSAGSYDPDGQITDILWDFGDGTTSDQADDSHIYSNPSNFTVTLTLTDNDGATANRTANVAVQVKPNEPPVAVIQANPVRGIPPLTVQFTGSNSTDSDGQIDFYAWQFGDGQGSNSPDPSYTYTIPGTYNATLTVTDNDGGSDQASVTIEVLQLPDPSIIAADIRVELDQNRKFVFFAWVKNFGPVAADNINILANRKTDCPDDRQILETKDTTTTVAANDSVKLVFFSIRPEDWLQPFAVEVIVNNPQTINEADFDNNKACQLFQPSLPDLYITPLDIEARTTLDEGGYIVLVEATVHNAGAIATRYFYVTASIKFGCDPDAGEYLKKEVRVDELGPAGLKKIELFKIPLVQWSPSFAVYVNLNWPYPFDEPDYENNKTCKEIPNP